MSPLGKLRNKERRVQRSAEWWKGNVMSILNESQNISSTLLTQIEERRKEILADSYSMSIGELLSMYRDEELILRPEFQRLYRWTPEQKSRFVESILLGIPIPSIFVAQRKDGKWEVVDGLQRVSTVLELVGELLDPKGNRMAPLQLTSTKYLPGMKGLKWKIESREDNILPDEAKLRIKRSRFDLNIILSESDSSAKYELFQRLNTGGSPATEQAVRNAILTMVNQDFFDWLRSLADDENFKACIPLTDRALEEQFDLELVTRFVVFRSLDSNALRKVSELGDFLTDKIVEMAEDEQFDREATHRAFKRTFEVLAHTLEQDSFKKYDSRRKKAVGAFLTSIFEVLAIGIGTYANEEKYHISSDKIRELHRQIPSAVEFTSATGSGIRASTRIPKTIELGRQWFKP